MTKFINKSPCVANLLHQLLHLRPKVHDKQDRAHARSQLDEYNHEPIHYRDPDYPRCLIGNEKASRNA